MRPYVKICGLTTLEDARYCAAAGAEFLGFIQFPPSPRYITPRAAAAIMEWIHGSQSVGVFVNGEADQVNETVTNAGFDLVQLHGDESPAYCSRMVRPVIKAFRVHADTDPEDLRREFEAYANTVTWFLLDTWHPVLYGGTGTTFDWRTAQGLATDYPLILSGGLGPDNIDEAVNLVKPQGIDLSGSLERSPGHKDFGRVSNFFARLECLDT